MIKEWLTKNAVWLGALGAIATIISVPMIFLSAQDLSRQSDCDDFSGTWIMVDNPDRETARMTLHHSGCHVTGNIDGQIIGIPGGPFTKTVMGLAAENHLDFDIQRKHGECVNILKAFAEKEQIDKLNRLKVNVTEILGHCNDDVTPKTDKPNFEFKKVSSAS